MADEKRHEWTGQGGRWNVHTASDEYGYVEAPLGSMAVLPLPVVTEILRLAARERELAAVEDVIEDKGPLPEADDALSIAEQVRALILYAEAGNEYGVPAFQAREKELLALTGQMSEWIRALRAAWNTVRNAGEVREILKGRNRLAELMEQDPTCHPDAQKAAEALEDEIQRRLAEEKERWCSEWKDANERMLRGQGAQEERQKVADELERLTQIKNAAVRLCLTELGGVDRDSEIARAIFGLATALGPGAFPLGGDEPLPETSAAQGVEELVTRAHEADTLAQEYSNLQADYEALRREKADLMEQMTLDVRALNARAQEAEALRAENVRLGLLKSLAEKDRSFWRTAVLNRDDELGALRARVQALEGVRESPTADEAVALARMFHEAYERLAPAYGYETRKETREFNHRTSNGQLMIAVCGELLSRWPAPSRTPDDRSALKARVAELEKNLKREEAASEQLIRERDHFQERVDRLADELGVEEEWTNVTDRGQEAEYAANALVARLSRLDALLASEKVPDGLWKAVGHRQHGTEGWHSAVLAWRWFREQLAIPPAESREPNCPLKTGLRPCECDLPRCPVCNYTVHDARFEMDHGRCSGKIPAAAEPQEAGEGQPRCVGSPRSADHRWVGGGDYGDTGNGCMCADCGVDMGDLPPEAGEGGGR